MMLTSLGAKPAAFKVTNLAFQVGDLLDAGSFAGDDRVIALLGATDDFEVSTLGCPRDRVGKAQNSSVQLAANDGLDQIGTGTELDQLNVETMLLIEAALIAWASSITRTYPTLNFSWACAKALSNSSAGTNQCFAFIVDLKWIGSAMHITERTVDH